MAAKLTDDWCADMAEVVADLPVVCEFGGVTFTATASDTGESRAVEIEGVVYEPDLTICFARTVLTTLPRPDQQITVGGTVYRAMRVAAHTSGIGGVEVLLKAGVR